MSLSSYSNNLGILGPTGPRGPGVVAWTASTIFNLGDVVEVTTLPGVTQVIMRCITAHTSGATFDPNIANWEFVSQNQLPAFAANSVYPRGLLITYTRGTARVNTTFTVPVVLNNVSIDKLSLVTQDLTSQYADASFYLKGEIALYDNDSMFQRVTSGLSSGATPLVDTSPGGWLQIQPETIDLSIWTPTTDNMTLVVGVRYLMQPGHTVTFPTATAGQSIYMIPSNGNWSTLPFTFTEPAGWTIGAGQSNISATGDMVTFVAGSNNWLIATGGVALPPVLPTSVADIAAMDVLSVSTGQTINVVDVGGGKFASFYFPTTGLGSQSNRRLVSTDQQMSHSNFNGAQSGDLGVVAQDYVVHGHTFTAPIGAKRANVSAWATFKCEGSDDQQIWMHFKIKRVTGNVTVFDPGARPAVGLSSGNHTNTGTFPIGPSANTQSRIGQITMIDNEIDVLSGEQYIVEVNAQKRVGVGPTRFVQGLIKIDWRG